MTSAATAVTARPQGWLVSPRFDGFFIFGTALLAILGGTVASVFPYLYVLVLTFDLWLFGYHHVIATFTRLCFDRQSYKKSAFLIYGLGLAAIVGIVFVAKVFGLGVLTALYLYVQWFHYCRQSWGISRAYERNAPQGYKADRSWQTQAAFYSLPLTGILYRSYQNWDHLLGVPLRVIPVSASVVEAAAAVSLAFLLIWLVRIGRDWRAGVLSLPYAFYMFTHFIMFSVSYLVMPTINAGWVTGDTWHSLQYLLFVWLYNNRTYRGGVDPAARFLSFISQKSNMILYFGLTLILAAAVYMGINYTINVFWRGILPVTAIVYMSINFHHYAVDAIIWRMAWIKRGKKAMSSG